MTQEDQSWVVDVRKGLERKPRFAKSNERLIEGVPKSLLNKNTVVFYVPQVISLGPYHFQRTDPLLDDIQLLKSEVMHCCFDDGNVDIVIEKYKQEKIQKEIKEIYSKEFRISGEEFAWMIVRDSCFVVEVLLRFSEDEKPDKTAELRIHSILSRKRHHPLLNEIVKDMFKMENQLPLSVLSDIKSHLEKSLLGFDHWNWFESALKNLSPIEVADDWNRKYKKDHILQLLHDYVVDETSSGNGSDDRKAMTESQLAATLMGVGILLILLLLSPFFIIWLMWHYLISLGHRNTVCMERVSVPTADELTRLGVKFKRLQGKGIRHIKFKKSNCSLYLPKFNVDDRSEVMLRNLMALEICSEQEEKPITRYVLLMNDLINTSTDVAILREGDIIANKLGSDDEAAKLWNSMMVSGERPPYGPIDNASSAINGYRRHWWKVQWAQFQMAHCSKPWLVVSLLGGISLLLLTLVQVICLFPSCQVA